MSSPRDRDATTPTSRQRLAGAGPPRWRRAAHGRRAEPPQTSRTSPTAASSPATATTPSTARPGSRRAGTCRRPCPTGAPARRRPVPPASTRPVPTRRRRRRAPRGAGARAPGPVRRPRGSGTPRWSGCSPTRATSSARRAGRCSTAGRSPTAAAPEDAVLADADRLGAGAARARTTAPASVLRGRAGALDLVAFDVVYAVGALRGARSTRSPRRRCSAPSPALRLSPARLWKHRTGGLVPIPSGERGLRHAAGCCSPPRTARRCAGSSQDPAVQRPAARHRRRRRVLDGRRAPGRDPPRRPPARS